MKVRPLSPAWQALAMLAGLAPAATPQATEPRQGPPRELVAMVEDATLVSWELLTELTGEFEARHGVRVQLIELGGAAGTQDKLKFLLAGDLPLDLVRIDITELAAFRADAALIDLEPYFQADPNWAPEEFFPKAVDALRGPSGHLYGLPQTFTPYVMYVNHDLLAREGLQPPAPDWTWDDLEALARQVTRDTDGDGEPDQYGISITQWLQAVVPWVWQSGGDLLDARGERARMGDPAFVAALERLQRWLHTERIASNDATFASQLTQGLFQAGRCAFYGPVGYWETYRFQHLEFEWDVMPLPRDEHKATSVAMSCYVVPRTSRHPELAYAFLREVLTAEAYQREMARIGNGVPGRISAARSSAFLDPERAPRSEHVYLDVLEHARFMPPLANWKKIESLCQSELEGILLVGDLPAEEGCAAMARKTDEYLERMRSRAGRPPLPAGTIPLAAVGGVLLALALFLWRRGPRPGSAQRREERQAYAMLLPWAVGFAAFLLGPAIVSGVLACSEWSPLRPLSDARWAGTDHFERLASDPVFATSLRATLWYMALAVPLQLFTGLILALGLRRDGWLQGAGRTLCYVPAILSPVIVAAVWRTLLEGHDGPLNRLLRGIGLDPPDWLVEPNWTVPAFALLAIWMTGAQMLVFLAALKAIDPSLEDAARVDGAGRMRRIWHVVLPALTPVVLFNLITGMIAAAQVFAQPYILTQGGPGDASRFLVLYLYESGFRHLEMGYASAVAWVLFAILAGLTALVLWSSRRWVHYAPGVER